MKQCTFCGANVEGKFCVNCGQAQECLSCGSTFNGSEKFCASCGTQRAISQQSAQPNVQDSQQQDNVTNQELNQTTNQPQEPNQAFTPYQSTHSNQQTHQHGPSHIQQNYNQGFSPGGPRNHFSPPKKGPNKGLIWGIVGAVAIAAIIVCYFIFFKSPNTPSGVVEAFVDALDNQNFSKAREYLYEDEYIDVFEDIEYYLDFIPSSAELSFSVKIIDEHIQGNSAEVDTIMSYKASFMGESMSESDNVTFYLIKHNGKWKITSETF